MSALDADLVVLLVLRRRELGLTQYDVARAMGCTQATVSGLETGIHNASVDMLRRWAAALRMRLKISVEEVDDLVT